MEFNMDDMRRATHRIALGASVNGPTLHPGQSVMLAARTDGHPAAVRVVVHRVASTRKHGLDRFTAQVRSQLDGGWSAVLETVRKFSQQSHPQIEVVEEPEPVVTSGPHVMDVSGASRAIALPDDTSGWALGRYQVSVVDEQNHCIFRDWFWLIDPALCVLYVLSRDSFSVRARSGEGSEELNVSELIEDVCSLRKANLIREARDSVAIEWKVNNPGPIVGPKERVSTDLEDVIRHVERFGFAHSKISVEVDGRREAGSFVARFTVHPERDDYRKYYQEPSALEDEALRHSISSRAKLVASRKPYWANFAYHFPAAGDPAGTVSPD